MSKPLQICAIAVALMIVGGGEAAADPVSLPVVNQYVDTVDGYRLHASLEGLPGTPAATINPVPNIAATAFSKEGFLSGSATANIEGSGAHVTKATLILWVQFGCQTDLRSGATMGGNAQLSSLPFGISNIFGGGGSPPSVSSAAPSDTFNPTLIATVRPGNIYRAELVKKEFTTTDKQPHIPTREFHIAVRDTQVKVDGCGGPVSVRMIATAAMSTDSSDDWVNAYSDIVQL